MTKSRMICKKLKNWQQMVVQGGSMMMNPMAVLLASKANQVAQA